MTNLMWVSKMVRKIWQSFEYGSIFWMNVLASNGTAGVLDKGPTELSSFAQAKCKTSQIRAVIVRVNVILKVISLI